MMICYKATIIEAGKLESKIHWEGFSDQYDKWMRHDNMWKQRIPFIIGGKIEVNGTFKTLCASDFNTKIVYK